MTASGWPIAVFAFLLYLRAPEVLMRLGATAIGKEILVGAALLVLASEALSRGRFGNAWRRALPVLALWVGAALASRLNAADDASWLAGMRWVATGAVVCMVSAALTTSPRAVRRGLWAVIAAASVLSAATAFQTLAVKLGVSDFGLTSVLAETVEAREISIRAAGTYGDMNYFAQFLLVAFMLALERSWNEPRRFLAAWGVVAVGLVGATILLTYSRGAWVALVLMAPLLAVLLWKWRPSPWRVLAPALGLVLVLPVVGSTDVVTRVSGLFHSSRGSPDHGVQDRVSGLVAGARMFREHPVLGAGVGNFEFLFEDHADDLTRSPMRRSAAHNLYVETAAETGVVGLAAWAAIVGVLFTGLHATYRRLCNAGDLDDARMVAGLALGLLAYFAAALFLHMSRDHVFWMLAGIALAVPSAFPPSGDEER